MSGELVSTAVDIAAAAGPGIGGGLGAWGGFRFLRWIIEFIAKRVDIRAARLDLREKSLEQKFNDRLRHVEQELERYRRATMLLVNRMATQNPKDPVLSDVANILSTTYSFVAADQELDDLARRAERAVDSE